MDRKNEGCCKEKLEAAKEAVFKLKKEADDLRRYLFVNKKIFVCSPYRPTSKDPAVAKQQLAENVLRAKLACRLVAAFGYMPLCPHIYFTRFLDDRKPSERETGMEYGHDWLLDADECWVFGKEISEGMRTELDMAKTWEIPVRFMDEPTNIMVDMLEEVCKAQKNQSCRSITLGRLEVKKGV